ncbi:MULTISPECIES: N-acetylmuramoyl-L-alanine amidase family protein [unclassified Clostridium]|uniref:N-acetylmuramoyl-L-alanine amidase family protein n=1 Tax=unclassified Clostridium TaxID=2614128 RepID=UPI0002979A79|nr:MULTISPECIES: N-acetylmuramoyl-L-alanine amidase family protein [unclassified Clostridium]EKQ51793.1 MAG: putative cell wall binding protein [Clostridium sp. Maddingley MBC34-26]
MRETSKVLEGLCLGMGVISLLGVGKPVYATNDADITTKTTAQVELQGMPDVVDAGEHFTAPKDGDVKKLNVGWTNIQGHFFYCKDESRIKVTRWQQANEKWYYFSPSNYEMQTGWIQDGGTWYYLTDYSDLKSREVDIEHGLGSMKTGWLNNHGKWYFLNNNGPLKQGGWLQVNGTWYYFYSDGIMATSTTIDGYNIGSDGAWRNS